MRCEYHTSEILGVHLMKGLQRRSGNDQETTGVLEI